jgi:hypothetical protein
MRTDSTDPPNRGAARRCRRRCRRPDLIIQDELHLISGPLGSMAGLYETALETLSTAAVEGNRIRPKLVASTATVRRAQTQIRALFDRSQTAIFPPPGPSRADSFFAQADAAPARSRLYLGLAAPGRSPKRRAAPGFTAREGSTRPTRI